MQRDEMGTKHTANCECGFEQEVTVGGGRLNFHSFAPFPYYCECCGLVCVNTKAPKPVCPTCGGSDVQIYGTPPISLPIDDEVPVLMNWPSGVNKEGNLCPACKKMTLIFHHPHALFD